MIWKQPLLEARFIKRYKRFFADVELDGTVVTCHVANTGSLRSVVREGARALIAPALNPESKLKYSLKALESEELGWIGIDTGVPNRLLQEVAQSKRPPEWGADDRFQAEWKYSAETRFDGALWRGDQVRSVFEVKNGTLKGAHGRAQFPDAETERGQKHLRELMELHRKGIHCEMIFVIQRQDITGFEPASEIDPKYSQLLAEAVQQGVVVRIWVARVTEAAVEIDWQHPVTGTWRG